MNEEILDETQIEERMTAEELLVNLMQDLIFDNDPNDIASDFIDEFVLRDRPETPQILAMFETPTQNLVEMLIGFCQQTGQLQMQAINERGFQYLEGLKSAVKTQMTELAESN